VRPSTSKLHARQQEKPSSTPQATSKQADHLLFPKISHTTYKAGKQHRPVLWPALSRHSCNATCCQTYGQKATACNQTRSAPLPVLACPCHPKLMQVRLQGPAH
jgi:hypothetical protein